jgi:tetratricopeptide (TPR) repeat protein
LNSSPRRGIIAAFVQKILPQSARSWKPAAVSAALALLLYAHTLAGTWIYDDRFHTQDDPRLKEPGRWKDYFTQGYMPEGADHLWRPLVSLSYAAQWKTTGDRAWPFHAVNILLHALASALVAELALRLAGSSKVGMIAGCLFAAHPVHVEAVAYIVGRAESACAVGALAALVLMLRPMTRRRALAIFACFMVSLLSKEQGLLVPLMLAGIWVLRCRSSKPSADERAAVKFLCVIVVFSLALYIAYREHILPWYWETNLLDYAIQPMTHSPPRDRLLIPIALLGRAMALLVMPLKLAPEYGLAVITARQSLFDPYLYVGVASLLSTIVGAWIAWRRRAGTILFLLFGAGLTYFIVSNVKLIGVVFAERLLYLPSAFVLILVATALARLPRRAMRIVVGLLLIGLSVRTVTYAARWNDRLSFYRRSVADHPEAARLHILLARDLMDAGDWEGARRTIDEGLQYTPDYWKLWSLNARVAVEQGRWDDAQRAIDRAWTLDPFILDLLGTIDRLNEHRAATRPSTAPSTRP